MSLSFIALLSLLMVAFLENSIREIKLTSLYSSSRRVELLNDYAYQKVIGVVLDKIQRGGVWRTVNGQRWLMPLNTNYFGSVTFSSSASDPLIFSESQKNFTQKGTHSQDFWNKTGFGLNKAGEREEDPEKIILKTYPNRDQAMNLKTQTICYRVLDLSGHFPLQGVRQNLPMNSSLMVTNLYAPHLVSQWVNLSVLDAWRYPAGSQISKESRSARLIESTERAFVSHFDFLNYLKEYSNVASEEMMKFLGGEGFGLNSPSYIVSTPLNSTITYESSKDNPSILDIRVQKEFVRRNRENASLGDPLVSQRFPLGKIALLHSINQESNTEIESYFGLKRSTDGVTWIYRTGSLTIKTLEEVASLGREPDFFELLKAGILNGSISQQPGPAGTSTSNGICSDVSFLSSSPDLHLLTIGANIIDQFDADNEPTTIQLGSSSVYGNENLPYIDSLHFYFQVNNVGGGFGDLEGWIRPQIWNPYFKKTFSTSANIPNIRLRITGSLGVSSFISGVGSVNGEGVNYSGDNAIINLLPNVDYSSKPVALSLVSATSPDSNNTPDTSRVMLYPITTPGICGFYVGKCSAYPVNNTAKSTAITVLRPTTIFIEYQKNGTWYPYSSVRNMSFMTYGGPLPFQGWENNPLAQRGALPGIWNAGLGGDWTIVPYYFTLRTDPRTDRFGIIGAAGDIFQTYLNTTFRPSSIGVLSYRQPNLNLPTSNANTVFLGNTYFAGTPTLAALSENLQGSSFYYQDKDGIVRRGAGAYAVQGANEGYPMVLNNNNSRSMILNRPFKSVAELGFSYRDLPFKDIDFWTAESADAALLDLFSIEDKDEIVNTVNLYTASSDLLKAILLQNESDPSLAASSFNSQTISSILDLLESLKAEGKILQKSDLVTVLSPSLSNAFSSSISLQREKAFREAMIRRLADRIDFRTLHLMIDLQTEEYKRTPRKMSGNPMRQRVIYFVTIDRSTLKVIEKSMFEMW